MKGMERVMMKLVFFQSLLLLWIVYLNRAMLKVHHWIQMFYKKTTADGKLKDTKTTGYCECEKCNVYVCVDQLFQRYHILVKL